ncbi:MAG: ankyrin repeat domain-containing protein [Pseudomonadota bacterium]
MGRSVLLKLGAIAGFTSLALAGPLSAPLAAQGFSNGYEFLEAVKDREGDTVTEMLREPGTTVVNTRDITTGETGLHIVTQERDITWIRFLLQEGANPNVRDNRGVVPLQIAANLGFVEAVEALIKRGAQVDVADRTGETPLIAAVHRRDIAIIRVLLAQGANASRPDNSGRTARDYAELQNGNSLILAEFDAAEEAADAKGTNESYGPSF